MDNGGWRGRGRGRGRGRFGGRGRFEGRGGDRRIPRPDPQPCPITVDEEGNLKLKITCSIMREFAGAVIGRGGEHVTAIRSHSGALVHVCKADSQTGVQGVDLFGTLQQIGLAHAKLSSILSQHAGDWCHDKGWGPRVTFFLLKDMVSIVIGKKGSIVQRIIKDSGAPVRVSNEADATNLQTCQVYGSNAEAATAVQLLVDVLKEYDSASSRSIPRLLEVWDARRTGDMFSEPESGFSGGISAGGPARGRGRFGVYSSSPDNRYEPYSHSRTGVAPMHAPPTNNDLGPSQSSMVAMHGGVQVPNGPGGVPTVLIQQADGSLVQAQVLPQAGGQYTVQPANAAHSAVKSQYPGLPHMKSQYPAGQIAGSGPSVLPQQPGGGGMGQAMLQGPGGTMYPPAGPQGPEAGSASAGQVTYGAAVPSYGNVGSAAGVSPYQSVNPEMQAGMGGGVSWQMMPGSSGAAPNVSSYQVGVVPQGSAQPMRGMPTAADPIAYAKLANYGQAGDH